MWINRRNDSPILLESKILIFEAAQRGSQKTGGSEKNQRQGGLTNHQRPSCQRAASGRRTACSAKRLDRVDSRGHPRRRDTENQRRDQGDTEGEKQDRRRGRGLDWNPSPAGCGRKREVNDKTR